MAENLENLKRELDPSPSEEFKLPKEEMFEPLGAENSSVIKEEEHTMEKLEIKGINIYDIYTCGGLLTERLEVVF